MIKMRCEDLFASVLFSFDGRNPITALCTLVGSEENLVPELAKIFNDEGESFALDYVVNRYDRRMSPLYERLYEHYEENLTNTNEEIAKIIKMKYLYNWNKLAEGLFADYNPIDNYNMIENKETDFEEHTVTDSTEKVTNKYNGFNSTAMQDVSESNTEGNIDTTKNDTGSKAKNELTRRGNIGVTTTAQMIEGELKLRKKTLFDVIYKDIDTILFIDYYN